MEQKAWLISVNMGYGHQRTAYPLRRLAFSDRIINANDYEGIPFKDKRIWEGSRKFYEFISNFKRAPFLGNLSFSIFDAFQKILRFYPQRDLSGSNFAARQIYSFLKMGWGKDLILRLSSPRFRSGQAGQVEKPLPVITTFFTPAFMAEFFNYPGEIFCVVCDADISRAWVPLRPQESKIKYFVPNERVVERLKLYGVKPENIFLTGYPLPLENIGTERMEILKEDMGHRVLNLDPQKKYFEKYRTLIEENLGKLPERSSHPLTILFSVGGAGTQREIGTKILESLAKEIKSGQIKIIFSAGVKEKVKKYFEKKIKELNLQDCYGEWLSVSSEKNIEILFGEKGDESKDSSSPSLSPRESSAIEDYFQKFNQVLRRTDVLWTKPSELSFYSALGLPIIIAPPVGSQEQFNMRWLLKSGFGILQENPGYAKEWFFDWLKNGYLAEAAMQGFVEGEKLGTFNIQKIVCGL